MESSKSLSSAHRGEVWRGGAPGNPELFTRIPYKSDRQKAKGKHTGQPLSISRFHANVAVSRPGYRIDRGPLAGRSTANSNTVAKLDRASGTVGYRAGARWQDTEIQPYDQRGRRRWEPFRIVL